MGKKKRMKVFWRVQSQDAAYGVLLPRERYGDLAPDDDVPSHDFIGPIHSVLHLGYDISPTEHSHITAE